MLYVRNMTFRRNASVAAFVGAVLLLLLPIALASGGLRIGAAGGLAGMLAGFAALVNWRRIEHADDADASGIAALAVEAISISGLFWTALCAFFAVVLLAEVAPASGRRAEVEWLGPLLAVGAGGALAVAMVWAVKTARRQEGVERAVFHESGAIAFILTIVGAAIYALFEAFADAPKLSMWAVWGFGWAVYTVVSGVLRHRAA